MLKGLTFTVPSGSTCGVVGRTGSGKSSLLLALLQLIPVEKGRVLLGGVDVASVSLKELRRQVAIIPQDPLLFSGAFPAKPYQLLVSCVAVWQCLAAGAAPTGGHHAAGSAAVMSDNQLYSSRAVALFCGHHAAGSAPVLVCAACEAQSCSV